MASNVWGSKTTSFVVAAVLAAAGACSEGDAAGDGPAGGSAGEGTGRSGSSSGDAGSSAGDDAGGSGSQGTGGSPEAGNGGNIGGAVNGAAGAGNVAGSDAGGASGGAEGGAAGGWAGEAGAAGSGGSAASGGTDGAGGAACSDEPGTLSELLITDLEANSGALNPPRSGFWFTFADPGANITPEPDPTGSSFLPVTGGADGTDYAARMTGSGGKYAVLAFYLSYAGDSPCTYEASAYSGIEFWYSSSHPVRVALATLATTSVAGGGTCSSACDNHHGADLPATPSLTPVTVDFDELAQEFGTLSPFKPSELLYIAFMVDGVWNPDTMQVDPIEGEYTVVIDEVSFVP